MSKKRITGADLARVSAACRAARNPYRRHGADWEPLGSRLRSSAWRGNTTSDNARRHCNRAPGRSLCCRKAQAPKAQGYVARTPYINHPLALANLLADAGGVTDPIVLAAALLHDTIEDTETSLEELTGAFGPLIASIVQEVTDDDGLPKRARKQLQIDRAPHLSERARLVKLADKICNLRDLAENPPPEWSPDVRRRYFDWAKEVVDALGGVHPKLESLFDSAYAEKPE